MVKFSETLVLPYDGPVIPTEDSLRKFVKLALFQRRLTYCQMARELEDGPCEKQLYRWFKGENSMSYANIEKLIKYLIRKDEERFLNKSKGEHISEATKGTDS
ncbi:MAG: hypothetical protein LIP15_04100 [Clostridium sp.]|nr:hypothetical protein [Clostridium sp.]